ncbi:hypothetical protein FRACA_1140006 [Frankia canadensis]|uniref:Uncharacterized protein n=1 Tax=Frankia canadensis TaxID=1836972 RepID=A0A2I2KJI3_9ACTN|nr:hypothetical protein FRACA_1140006 [Frankia canadensis]SOU53122.1 hypothetical protein FRACA_1140006 [Frankia canadensis]
MELELLQDVANVVLHRVLADVQLLGDVAVVHALGDEPQHLHLPVGEPGRGQLRPVVLVLDHGRELAEELRRHGRADQALPAVDRPDVRGDLVDRDLLQQVAHRPRLDRVVEVGLLVTDRQHHDLRARHRFLDGAGRVDSAAPRHPHVHEHNVRGHLLRHGHCLGTIRGLADDLDVNLLAEHHLQPATEQCVVVDDEHPDRIRLRRRRQHLLSALLIHRHLTSLDHLHPGYATPRDYTRGGVPCTPTPEANGPTPPGGRDLQIV